MMGTMPAQDSVAAVLERLGGSLLHHEAGPAGHAQVFEHVAVFDPVDDAPLPARALVLGVGARGAGAIAALLDRVAGAGARALVVRAPAEIDEAVRSRAAAASVCVLSLVAGAAWLHLAALLQPRPPAEDDGWTAVGTADAELDLFKVANSLSAVLDAPVTIEDLRSRILAFSADQARADEARKTSVLGQQVPDTYQAPLTSLGIFRTVYASPRPLFVAPFVAGMQSRVALRVRAGDELLGSVWAVVDRPLPPAHEEAMVEAANVAAIAMLRWRIGADAVQRTRFATVATLIEGGPQAVRAAEKLRSARAVAGGCVLAAGLAHDAGTSPPAERAAGLDHLASSLTMRLRRELPDSICAVLGDAVYGVVPAHAGAPVDPSVVRRVAAGFAQHPGPHRQHLLIGIGAPVDRVADLDRSREDADLVLRVLRTSAAGGTPQVRVAAREDVYARSLLLRMSDLLAGDAPGHVEPVGALRAHDLSHGSALVPTLRCWLDAFGDVAVASEQLRVHKNTLRYRLKRIAAITGLDLDDPEQRFELMLRFRLEP